MSKNHTNQLESLGAVLHGHFELTSGLHADTYIEKFRLLQQPDITEKLCQEISERFLGFEINTVAGPTTGGAILSFEVARQMGIRSLVAESSAQGGREFRRGYTLGPKDRVLIIDDVLTTGGSVRDVIDAVEQAGAEVVGVAILVDRSGGSIDFKIPLYACITLQIETFDPVKCPLCQTNTTLLKT
jgi:orotate phosphoribosyltransferase